MITAHYQEQLRNLREAAVGFARAHPALAPMLREPSVDPDVERLLEGVAFLTGLVRAKLDDDFPELIQGLLELVYPQLLRPMPAATILAFATRPNGAESVRVPAGTAVASIPVDGTSCRFRTCAPVEVHPIRLVGQEASTTPGQGQRILLEFQLQGLPLGRWRPTELVLYLGGNDAEAATLFLLLTRYLQRVTVLPRQGGSPWVLPGAVLAPAGFGPEHPLVPYPDQAFQGYRLLQDYFALPQKYLFLTLRGWEGWTDRGPGSAFRVQLDLDPAPVSPPRLHAGHFVPGATPAVNLFPAEAEPFLLDHRQEAVPLRPAGFPPGHAQVFAVDRVTGFQEGTLRRREYAALDQFAGHGRTRAVYQVRRSRSPLDGLAETRLSFAYPQDSEGPTLETVRVALTCSNGSLPAHLQVGELCRQTETSSELLEFHNLMAPTSPAEAAPDRLWQLLSHLNLNLTSLARPGHLQALLRLYCQHSSGRAVLPAHLKGIEGLAHFEARPADLLLNGRVYRGQRATLTADAGHFASLGSLHLFAAVLDRFLAAQSGCNAYSQLVLNETSLGGTFTWPARLGEHPLI